MEELLLIVRFDMGADIVDTPPFIVESAEEYRKHFLQWLGDKNNNHRYWYYHNGVKFGLDYRSEAFVEWLNAFPLADNAEKARVVAAHVYEYDETLPSIFF